MYSIYQVEYGDTIEKIANKTGTTPSNIKNINGFNSDDELVVGTLIIVPKTQNQFFKSYVVKQGDTIYSISRDFNIDPGTLLLLNGLNKDDYIYPNQQLTVPDSNAVIYITKDGDTLDFIINNLGIDANTLNRQNEKIFVIPEQLIVYKKEGNM